MEQGCRHEQVFIYKVGVELGQKLRNFEHIGAVHEQTSDKVVVDKLSGRNFNKVLRVPFQHLFTEPFVVRIIYFTYGLQYIFIALFKINRGGGKNVEVRNIVVLAQQSDVGAAAVPCGKKLGLFLIFLNNSSHLYYTAVVICAEFPRIVPSF